MAEPLKPDIMIEADKELCRQIRGITWKRFIPYGNVRIQVRDGEATLITLERTLKPE